MSFPDSKMSRVLAAGLAAGCLAGAGSLAVARLADPPAALAPGPDDHPMNYGGKIQASGPGLSLSEAAQQVTSETTLKSLLALRVGPGPEDSPFPKAAWLDIEISADSLEGPGKAMVTWQAALAQGAVADLHRTDEASTNAIVGGSDIHVTLPDSEVTLDGSAGFVAAGQTFSAQATELSATAIQDSVVSTAESFGLLEVTVDVLNPLGPAVSVHATMPVTDPDKPLGWTLDELRDSISGDPAAFEGIYIEVASPSGEPLAAAGVAYRTGVGIVWFAPGQDDRFGLVHGHAVAENGRRRP